MGAEARTESLHALSEASEGRKVSAQGRYLGVRTDGGPGDPGGAERLDRERLPVLAVNRP
jgi:hypothetical protein